MESSESAPAGDGLQFDQAEYLAPETRACALCRAAIHDQYFVANGKTLCTACHGKLQTTLAQGSAGRRFFAALGWGGAGALVGAAIYYGIRVATGYELGLVAIVVGVLVGKGVARGAGGLAGRGYAFMAVMLTYFSIVLTYVPEIVGAWEHQTAATGPIAKLIFGMLIFGLTLFSPIVVGVKAPLSLIITGIALYEAWKITRRSALTITGPHALAPAQPTPKPAADGG
jgi:hypothetical protein